MTDQVGNPTYVDDLAFAILKVVEFDKEGVYNIGGRDFVDRYTFAIKLAEIFGFDKGYGDWSAWAFRASCFEVIFEEH